MGPTQQGCSCEQVPVRPDFPPNVVNDPQLDSICDKIDLLCEKLTGEPLTPMEKSSVVTSDWIRKSDCVPFQKITCLKGKEITFTCWLNLETNELTETIDMSDVEFANGGFTPEAKTLEVEIEHFALQGAEFSGTIEDLVTLALAESGIAFLTDNGEQKFPVTPGELCAYKVKAAPCDASVLTDPLDPASAVKVPNEGTFVNGVQVAGDADAPFAEANLAAPVAQVAEAYSAWCFQFKLEGTCDKEGVFTPNNAKG